MNSLLAPFTVFLVALHSILGCCWHHPHATAGTGDRDVSASREHFGGVACQGDVAHDAPPGHERHGQEQQESGQKGHSPEQGCDVGPCAYVRGESAPEILDQVQILDGLFAVIPGLLPESAATSPLHVAKFEVGISPIPRHLLFQVLRD